MTHHRGQGGPARTGKTRQGVAPDQRQQLGLRHRRGTAQLQIPDEPIGGAACQHRHLDQAQATDSLLRQAEAVRLEDVRGRGPAITTLLHRIGHPGLHGDVNEGNQTEGRGEDGNVGSLSIEAESGGEQADPAAVEAHQAADLQRGIERTVEQQLTTATETDQWRHLHLQVRPESEAEVAEADGRQSRRPVADRRQTRLLRTGSEQDQRFLEVPAVLDQLRHIHGDGGTREAGGLKSRSQPRTETSAQPRHQA